MVADVLQWESIWDKAEDNVEVAFVFGHEEGGVVGVDGRGKIEPLDL